MGFFSMSQSGGPSTLARLFPTKISFLVFVLYMALFINQGILVTASQNGNHGYNYNTVMAVLLTELIKLAVSTAAFIHRNSSAIFFTELQQNSKVFLLYFIPAGLYCLYNNLAYTNLITFDPTTYFLLLQLRVVVTGIVFQVLFRKKLSRLQWVSMLLLTVGCMVKELKLGWLFDPEYLAQEEVSQKTSFLQASPFGILLILLQVFSSSAAGVYNEYLLKASSWGGGNHLSVLVQNVCLYVDSIICNLALLLIQGNIEKVNLEGLTTIVSNPLVLAVVINNAAIGIVTSFFLAQLNSILKTFASALELMFTAILCWIIFGIPVHLNTVLAITIVTAAIFLYAREPVNNTKVGKEKEKPSDEESLQKMLDEEIDA